MKKQFFIKNLMYFLFPLLTTVLILGSLSIFVTQRSVENENNRNNIALFTQIDRDLELIFNEMDALSISFGTSNVLYQLENILRTETLTFDNLRLLENIQNYINAPANARPYIESIYVYVDNPNGHFFTSVQGLTSDQSFYDMDWLESFKSHRQNEAWTQSRSIQRYSFEQPMAVTTVYQNLFSGLHDRSIGVIVLNIHTSYIEKLLQNMKSYDGQKIVVLNSDHHIVFQNEPLDPDIQLLLDESLFATPAFSIMADGVAYRGSHLYSDSNGWRYVSIVPEKTLKATSSRLRSITLLFVLLSLMIGIVITYILTKRWVRHVRQIIMILNAAERGQPLPSVSTSRSNDEYNYITQNIIKNFIEQNYLKVQLSEKKYKLQVAELLALQSQMNPHFLFNTMETINWKVLGLTGKPNEATRMIGQLSNLLKFAMDYKNQIIPLDKEIKHTMNYIEIQKVRYRDQFTVLWEIDEGVGHYGIIKLILQPIIENSIYHGIKEKESAGKIKIKVWEFESYLCLSIIDNGVGMHKERLQEIYADLGASSDDFERASSIGLYNTNKRLVLTYGPDYALRLLSKQGWGTVVQIRIPFA